MTFLGVPFGKIHDLPELLILLPADSSVPAAVGDLSGLADAAVAARYPDDLSEYDRVVAEDTVRQAETVKSAVLRELTGRGYTPRQ